MRDMIGRTLVALPVNDNSLNSLTAFLPSSKHNIHYTIIPKTMTNVKTDTRVTRTRLINEISAGYCVFLDIDYVFAI